MDPLFRLETGFFRTRTEIKTVSKPFATQRLQHPETHLKTSGVHLPTIRNRRTLNHDPKFPFPSLCAIPMFPGVTLVMVV